MKSLILTYHRVTDDDAVSDFYDVPVSLFRRQVEIIAARTKAMQTMVTFDDGTADHMRAAEILAQHRLKGVFFLVLNRLDRPGSLERGDVERLVALDQIVGSHTVSHPQLPTLTDADLAFELADSRRQLEDLSGRAVTWFAPPGGHYDGRTLPAAREVGYRYIRTMDWGYAPTLEASGVDRLLSTVPILRNTSERRLEAILEGHAKFPGFALKQLARRLLPPEAYARLRKLTIQSQS